jgi:hypothetical protein
MRVWVVSAAALLLAAFTVPDIEPVYAVSAAKQGLTVRVGPAGCTTTKSDLTVAVANNPTGPLLLIARKEGRPLITCRSAAPADITWSWEDLGLTPGQPFRLANPLVSEAAAH